MRNDNEGARGNEKSVPVPEGKQSAVGGVACNRNCASRPSRRCFWLSKDLRSGTANRLLTIEKRHEPQGQRRRSVLSVCYCPAVLKAGYVLLELASISTACPNGEFAEGGEITMKMWSQVPDVKVQPAGITPVPVESIA